MEKLTQKIRGILIFYRSFLVPSILVTVFCCVFAVIASVEQQKNHEVFYGIFIFFPQGFWIKTFSNIFIVFYLLNFKANELYFYYNLGIRKIHLWLFTFAIDYIILVLFFCLSGLAVKLIHI